MANPVTYRQRRAKGLCGACGKVQTGTAARCDDCKSKELGEKKARYEARKAAGLCPQCGEPTAGTVLCAKCQNKQTGAKSRYHRNKARGVCRYCGQDSGGKARCDACAKKFKDYQRQRYQQQKAAGACPNCGNVLPADDDHVLCPKCRDAKTETSRERWQRLRDAAFAAYGGPVCSLCGEPDSTILELDHINGGGNAHRREIGQSNLYLWLKQHDYPPGFRVLCPTCNKKAHVQARACP